MNLDMFDGADTDGAIATLCRYGHLQPMDHQWDHRDYVTAIRSLQEFNDLKVDGHFGPVTETQMDLPRCGVPDILPVGEGLRRWIYLTPTYGHNMGNEANEVVEYVRHRMNEFSGLKLGTGHISSANIFGTRRRIDGPNRILGWSGLPPFSGANRNHRIEQRFDSRDAFDIRLFWHELGHAMGFGHTSNRNSIMTPFLNRNLPESTFEPVFAQGMVARHGPPGGEPPPPT